MKKKIKIIIIFIVLLIPFFITKKDNIIKDLTFNKIEDKNAPIKYKKEYTFTIKEISGKDNSLEFNIINHYVEVYINGNLIYKIKDIEQTIENKLVKIPLNKKHINKKVKIILTPLDENTDNNLDLKIK